MTETTQTAAAAKREYKLAAYPVQSGPQKGRREILEITGDDRRPVILVVANDDAMDVRDTLARAYQDGREDNAAMLAAEGRLRTEPLMTTHQGRPVDARKNTP